MGAANGMVLVRDLEPGDFIDLEEYYSRFYDEVKENPYFGVVLSITKPSSSDGLEWFSRIYRNAVEGHSIVLVAEMDSHVVGLCEASVGRPGSEVSNRGDLGLAVSREHRGQGVGTALLREMLRRCQGKFEVLELSVFSKNQVARKLYAKFVFKTFGVRPRSVRRGRVYFDEELMRLNLKTHEEDSSLGG